MPRFAANLSTLFSEVSFLERFGAGRHEPGTGEINYGFLFQHLDRIGYDGWVGCEYRPLTTTTAGLGWLAPYLDRRAT